MKDSDAVYEVLRKMIDLEKLPVEELKILDESGLIVKITTETGWKYVFNSIGVFYLTTAAKVQRGK